MRAAGGAKFLSLFLARLKGVGDGLRQVTPTTLPRERFRKVGRPRKCFVGPIRKPLVRRILPSGRYAAILAPCLPSRGCRSRRTARGLKLAGDRKNRNTFTGLGSGSSNDCQISQPEMNRAAACPASVSSRSRCRVYLQTILVRLVLDVAAVRVGDRIGDKVDKSWTRSSSARAATPSRSSPRMLQRVSPHLATSNCHIPQTDSPDTKERRAGPC